jgi:cation transport regulator
MPYRSTLDLPPPIREHLPIHAQEIFMASFNDAFEEYAGRADGEAIAFRVAWAAVKRKYRKIGDEWIEK